MDQLDPDDTLTPIHPATAAVLRFFAYQHLPAVLQEISKPLHDLAWAMARKLPGDPELTAGLRKLLEAKDCLVRAALPPAPAYPLIPRDTESEVAR